MQKYKLHFEQQLAGVKKKTEGVILNKRSIKKAIFSSILNNNLFLKYKYIALAIKNALTKVWFQHICFRRNNARNRKTVKEINYKQSSKS